MEVGFLYLGVVAAIVFGLVLLVSIFAFRSRDRWLVEGKQVAAGVGAFRQGPTKGLPEVQHRRWLMVPVAVGNILLAVFTTFFLCPAGLLGALVLLSESHKTELFWGAIGVAALDGFPLSIMLVATSIMLARRSRTVVPVALITGAWGVLHHGAIVAMGCFQILVIDTRRMEEVVFAAIGIAAVGMLPCLLTVVAGILSARDAKTLPVAETG